MQELYKNQNRSEKPLDIGGLARRFFYISVSAFVVFLFSFLVLPYLSLETNAEMAQAGVSWGSISLELDPDYGNGDIDDEGHGDILFGEIVPTEKNGESYGTLMVVKKTIGINSSGKYYAVYLSMAPSEEAGSLNSNGLILQTSAGSDSAISIPAISASFSSPAKFSGSAWGFAVPGVEETGIDDAPESFVVPSLVGVPINSGSSAEGAAETYENTKWVAVPAEGSSPRQIWKATASGADGEAFGFGTYTTNNDVEVTGDTVNNHFDIYYGVAVDNSTLAGTYSNKIVYTALASTASLDSVSTNLLRDVSYGTGGETETIRFDLAESVAAISEDMITVAMVPHYVFQDNEFSISGLNLSDYKKCEVVDNSLSFLEFTEVKCQIPTDVTEVADSFSDSSSEDGRTGRYDFWLHIDGYNLDYVSKISDGSTEGTREAFAFVGLQSRFKVYRDSAYEMESYVTKMQEMTPKLCKNTNMWGSKLGEEARIYDQSGETGGKAIFEAGVDKVGVSTFNLTDTRDSKTYLVRRMADEDCWMMDTLSLDLDKVASGEIVVDNRNTDLRDVESWNGVDGADENSIPKFAQVEGRSYYNWYAATAGYGRYDITGYETDYNSICPKGWGLSGEYVKPAFYYLLGAYGATLRVDDPEIVGRFGFELPTTFSLDGVYSEKTGTSGVGTSGYFWEYGSYPASSEYKGRAYYSWWNQIYVRNIMGVPKTDYRSVVCIARE